MNKVQNMVFKAICRWVVDNPDLPEMLGPSSPVKFNLPNLIAHYSLANEYYYATDESYDFLLKNNFFDSDGYVSRGSKRNQPLTWEHSIPCNLVGKYFLENHESLTPAIVENTLESVNKVVILTREQDNLLFKNLRSNMPSGWKMFEDSWLARYEEVGIIVNQQLKVPMKNKTYR